MQSFTSGNESSLFNLNVCMKWKTVYIISIISLFISAHTSKCMGMHDLERVSVSLMVICSV